MARFVSCSGCGARVRPATDPPPASTTCGRCWARETGDYPGRVKGDKPPTWLVDVVEARDA